MRQKQEHKGWIHFRVEAITSFHNEEEKVIITPPQELRYKSGTYRRVLTRAGPNVAHDYCHRTPFARPPAMLS